MISVQEARRRATTLYANTKLGIDPAQRKEEAKLQAAETVKAKLPHYLARQQERVRDGHLRQSSYVEIERHVLVHSKVLHAKPLAGVTRRDVATVLSSLTEKLSGATVNRVQTTLSGFFAWSMREGLIDSNPVEGTVRREEGERTRTTRSARHLVGAPRGAAYGRSGRRRSTYGCRLRAAAMRAQAQCRPAPDDLFCRPAVREQKSRVDASRASRRSQRPHRGYRTNLSVIDFGKHMGSSVMPLRAVSCSQQTERLLRVLNQRSGTYKLALVRAPSCENAKIGHADREVFNNVRSGSRLMGSLERAALRRASWTLAAELANQPELNAEPAWSI